MKTKYFATAALALALTAGFSSCEDRLDISQHGVLNYETFYQTDEEAEQAVIAAYIQINGSIMNYHLILNSMGNDFWSGGGARNDNSDLEQFNEFTYGVDAPYIEGLFSSLYGIIYKCNVVLGHVAGDTPVQQQCHAEAKTLRAWAYFHLINLWGPCPLVDHELTPNEYSLPNTPVADLWAFIEQDLNDAINSGAMPEKSSLNDNVTWRVTKQFAQTLLGKAYMWQGKYSDAIKQFDAVINSGKYALYTGNYGDMLGYNEKHNCESMFESNRVYDTNNEWQNFDMTAVMCHWRIDKMNAPEGYSGLESAQGWGFLVPQQNLYDDFVAVEGENGYRLNETMKTYAQIQEMGWSVKDAIINEGYFMWKWRFLDEACPNGCYAMVCDNNPRWMRYAEVILCAAEANFEGGNKSRADELMNMIRTRAQAPTKSGYTREEIRREKRIELCGEYTRWMDLMRWSNESLFPGDGNLAYNLLKNQGEKLPFLNPNGQVEYKVYNTNTNLFGFKQNKHERLPFPGTEMRLNPNIQQNPGW